MKSDPLAAPKHQQLLVEFCQFVGITPKEHDPVFLGELARAFSYLPYENLTKIIKEATLKNPEQSRRLPDEVLLDHQQWGTGGTCFSLTAALLHLVRSAGFSAEPILADRRYGANTHCAILVWLKGVPHLLDPGYLILDPIVLPEKDPRELSTQFNRLLLVPTKNGDQVELYTLSEHQKKFRLTFKTSPADPREFLHAWDSSFDWDMMHYPVLTKIGRQGQLFMRGNRLQTRIENQVRRVEIPKTEIITQIAKQFGIHPKVVKKALSALEDKGDSIG